MANEACAAGLPVIVSPEAGVAGELVRHQENGHVLPLDVALWVEVAASLLLNPHRWERMSARSLDLVRPYTYRNAAAGLLAAIRHAQGLPVPNLPPELVPATRAPSAGGAPAAHPAHGAPHRNAMRRTR